MPPCAHLTLSFFIFILGLLSSALCDSQLRLHVLKNRLNPSVRCVPGGCSSIDLLKDRRDVFFCHQKCVFRYCKKIKPTITRGYSRHSTIVICHLSYHWLYMKDVPFQIPWSFIIFNNQFEKINTQIESGGRCFHQTRAKPHMLFMLKISVHSGLMRGLLTSKGQYRLSFQMVCGMSNKPGRRIVKLRTTIEGLECHLECLLQQVMHNATHKYTGTREAIMVFHRFLSYFTNFADSFTWLKQRTLQLVTSIIYIA